MTPGACLATPGVGAADPAQYLGAGAAGAPPAGAVEAGAPVLAGVAAPPLALQELFPPAGGGDAAPGSAAPPPPQPTMEPISIPATADIARAFAIFIVRLLAPPPRSILCFPAMPRRFRSKC